MHLQAKGRSDSDTSLEAISAARGDRIFSAYFSVNCLLHISVNYTENVTDLYAHAQTVDTRRSSPIFQAPGYEAKVLHKVTHCAGCITFKYDNKLEIF